MSNPFKENLEPSENDAAYVEMALTGDPAAMETLVLRHQSWIYNIAITMVGDTHTAEDVTQEVLIKIITKLSTYDPNKASFRTWLYRIVVNHIINMKENKREILFQGLYNDDLFEKYVNSQPDRRKSANPEYLLLRQETKTLCVLCMLLCLTRRERIVFILGVIFDVTDGIGAEICGISRGNFRKILSRSRKKIYDLIHTNCSLINEENPCHCEEQAGRMIRAGIISTENPVTRQDSLGTISEMLGAVICDIEDSYYEFVSLFRSQPFLRGPDMVNWLRDLIKKNDFNTIFSN